jgi:L-fuculose-phosphate aldolase
MNVLRFAPNATEKELRLAVVEAGRIAYERGLLASNDGNLSARMHDGNILMSPSGLCKGRMEPEDLLVVDIQGALVQPASDRSLTPTSEQPMHLEVYRQRPDVRAVIHAHPPYATALTLAGKGFRTDALPEVIVLLGEVPVTDFALPSGAENAAAIRRFIGSHDALMIRQHGSLTVGRNMDEALINLERLEHVAKTITLAEMLGQINPLPPAMMERLTEMFLERVVNEEIKKGKN